MALRRAYVALIVLEENKDRKIVNLLRHLNFLDYGKWILYTLLPVISYCQEQAPGNFSCIFICMWENVLSIIMFLKFCKRSNNVVYHC